MNTSKFYSAKSSARRAAKQAGLNPDAVEYVTENDQWAYVIPTAEVVVEAPAVEVVPVSNTEEVFEEGPVRKEMTFDDAGNSISVEDKSYLTQYGHVNCPHCSVHLSNGIGHHGQDVNEKIIKHKQFQYECLACGGEFGPAIATESAEPAKAPAKSIPHENSSTITNPCKTVWEIAIKMEGKPRKEVVAACVAAGVAYYTARTQFQAWYTANKAEKKAIADRATKAASSK